MDIFERLRIAKEKLAAETPATNYQQSYVRDTTPVAEPPKLPPGPAFGGQSAPASLRPLRAPQTLTAPSAATVLKPHPQPAATPMPDLSLHAESLPDDTDDEALDAMAELLGGVDMSAMDLDGDNGFDEYGEFTDEDEHTALESEPGHIGLEEPAPAQPRHALRPLGEQKSGASERSERSAAEHRTEQLAPSAPRPRALPTLAPKRAQPTVAPETPPAVPAEEHAALAAPAPEKPKFVAPAGSQIAKMLAAKNATSSFEASGLALPARHQIAQSGAEVLAAAEDRIYSPEEFMSDWEDLPDLPPDADQVDGHEFDASRAGLLRTVSARLDQIFRTELSGLSVAAASDHSILELSQLVYLTFQRVKEAPGAWAMLDLADKAQVIKALKAMAAKRHESAKTRKPREAATLSMSLEEMANPIAGETSGLDTSGMDFGFGSFGV